MSWARRTGLLLLAFALAPASARADWCIDYSDWFRKEFGRANYCWKSQGECRSFYSSRCLNPTYAKDCKRGQGCYEPPGTAPAAPKGGGGPAPGSAAAAHASAQAGLLQQQARNEKAADERAFQLGLKGLSSQLKGPPPAGMAQVQLGAVAGSGAEAARLLAAPAGEARDAQARLQADWPGLKPAPPPRLKAPPPASPPGEAARPGGSIPPWLLDALAGARKELTEQDREIEGLERQVDAGEKTAAAPAPSVDAKAPPAREDEALRRAKEALARARANRARTRAELERMEREAAKAPASTTGAGPAGP